MDTSLGGEDFGASGEHCTPIPAFPLKEGKEAVVDIAPFVVDIARFMGGRFVAHRASWSLSFEGSSVVLADYARAGCSTGFAPATLVRAYLPSPSMAFTATAETERGVTLAVGA